MATPSKTKKPVATRKLRVDRAPKAPPKSPKKAAANATTASDWRLKIRPYAKWLAIPALFYLFFFTLYASTWMFHFNTRFFADQGDGFQNVWNMWWVNFSVTHLHQLPWHTMYLHYPYGTTLLGQTLNPFNGFVGIFLMHVLGMSLVQAFNTMVIFSFVFGGMTTFWLCYYFSRQYIPSLIGGFIFTFSSYHFSHAIGHMQLVSLEWIPLFILLWWKLVTRPRYRYAVGAAVTLLFVLLCDYYYFLYSVAAAAMILIYIWHKKELPSLKVKQTQRTFLVFIILALIMVAPLPVALLLDNRHDPLLGAHDARVFSTDVLTPFIDGSFWHFASITHFYYKNLKAYVAETSVYFGVSVIVLLAIAFWKRNKLHRDVVFWIVLGLVFGILSMGPRLMINGYSINHAPLPYALLEDILPPLKLSGDPDRFIVMSFLAAAVLSAIVLSKLDLKIPKGRILMALFCVVLVFELWPGDLPVNIASSQPAYVNALAKLPYGAVLDNGAVSASWQLYDATIDNNKPIPLGYISRVPTSVSIKDNEFVSDVNAAGFPRICSVWKVRYITTPTSRPLQTNFPIVYRDKQTLIYDMKDSPNC